MVLHHFRKIGNCDLQKLKSSFDLSIMFSTFCRRGRPQSMQHMCASLSYGAECVSDQFRRLGAANRLGRMIYASGPEIYRKKLVEWKQIYEPRKQPPRSAPPESRLFDFSLQRVVMVVMPISCKGRHLKPSYYWTHSLSHEIRFIDRNHFY